MDFSNSESESGTFGSCNSTSVVSSSEADFVTGQELPEEATGWRGSPYVLNGSLQEIFNDVASKVRSSPQKSPNSNHLFRACTREELEQPADGHRGYLKRFTKVWIRISMRGLKQLRKGKLHQYRRKVTVNGVPIKDVDVRKAEELAGPIHPGNFWYDMKAGFWGMEPGPCLGIIPPCIPELNVPMSRVCSGGNTGILVNGRELHDKDLERLSFRGLPTTPGMAYCISIDGRVIDESSRKYVTSLGMLAPSLERSGRGAGLYRPAVYYLDSSRESSSRESSRIQLSTV